MLEKPQGRASRILTGLVTHPRLSTIFNTVRQSPWQATAMLAGYALALNVLVNADLPPALNVSQSFTAAAAATAPKAGTTLEQGLRDSNITVDGEQETDTERQHHIDQLKALSTQEKLNRTQVIELQSLLNMMDYGSGRQDGIFGARTAGAFTRFLQDNQPHLSKISPWVSDRLNYNGQRAALATLTRQATQHTGPDNPRPPVELLQTTLPAQAASQTAIQPMATADIQELQTILKEKGYLSVQPDGDFGFRTAGGLMAYLRDHKDNISILSPWVMQQLMNYGHQENLADLIHNNPAVWAKMSARLKITTKATDYESTDSVKVTQTLLRATGIYNGRVDGVRGPATTSALNDLDYYFLTADMSHLRKDTSVAATGSIRAGRPLTPSEPVGLDRATAQTLAAYPDFRDALLRGDTKRTLQYLYHADPTPIRMNQPVNASRISSHFGPRYVAGIDRRIRMHQGTDFAAPSGTRIAASEGGTVVRAGYHGPYGYSVMVDHGHNILTHYAHMSRISVRTGDKIQKGDIVGKVGSSGRSTGAHLHYEIILRDRTNTPIVINAEKFMNENLRDPKIHLAALADARMTVGAQGWKSGQVVSSFTSARVAPDRGAPENMTPGMARVLLDVLAADRTLLAEVPTKVLVGLRDMGFTNELKHLAYAEQGVKTVSLPTSWTADRFP